MQIERGRSNPGFSELPSVASSLAPNKKQPPASIATQPQKDQPTPILQQTINSQQQVPQIPAPTQPHTTPPTTSAPPQSSTGPQQTQSAPTYSRPTVQLRPRLPNLFSAPTAMPWPRMPAPVNPWAVRGFAPQQYHHPAQQQNFQYAQPEQQPPTQPAYQHQPEQVAPHQQHYQQHAEQLPPQQQTFQQHAPPLQDNQQRQIPNPGAWEDGYDYQDQEQGVFQDQQGYQPSQLSSTDLTTIRSLFPNLKDLSDSFLSSTPMATLLQMNQQVQQAPQASDMQAAMLAASAAAVQYSQIAGFNPTAQDPGVKMAKNLEKLKACPITIPEGLDDRINILHSARFLGGAVTSGTGLWLLARKVISLEGLTPLANYDLACMGLSGSVTLKGCIEAHNPGSQNLCLKMFSPENLSTTAGAARRFTLADDDGAISVGEHMKEITEMATLQHAMRALCGLTRIIMPWNFSFEAIHGFLYASNFGLPELKDDPLRVPKLVKFVNYVLGVNAAAWQREEAFLTCGQLKQEFGTYLQCQVSGAFVPAVPSSSAQPNNQQKNAGRGRGGGGGFRGGFNRGRGGFQYSSGRGGFNHNGGGGGGSANQNGGGGGNPLYNSIPGGYWTPSGYVILCKRFNLGNCKNSANNCALPTGAKAHHLCAGRKASGDICKEQHAYVDHK